MIIGIILEIYEHCVVATYATFFSPIYQSLDGTPPYSF